MKPGEVTSWEVTVKKLNKHTFVTVFRVGVQSFEIARAEVEVGETATEAEHHCQLMRNAFLIAIKKVLRLGIGGYGQ